MSKLGKTLGIVGLMLTVVPSFLIFNDTISLELNKSIILIGTLVWFIGAPLALNKSNSSD
ncbi:MAG: hypothetical protein AAF363_02860 [Bacteroidota bacterium]